MKKTLTKALSLILTACFIMSLCVCTTAMAADESIAEKTLKYFDEETWNSITVSAGKDYSYNVPNGISNLQINNGDRAKVEKVTRSENNFALKLSASDYTSKRTLFANVFEASNASSWPVNAAANDKFTVYMDLKTDSIPTNYTGESVGIIAVRVYGAKTTANTNNYIDVVGFANDGSNNYSIYGYGDKKYSPYTLEDWVNVAIEITFSGTNAQCTTYVNGVEFATSSSKAMTGLSYIRAGYQQSDSDTAQEPTLYIDNVAFYKSGFSTERYNAIEAASALSVADIIGNNTDLSSVEKNLTLIKSKDDSTITWASSNEAVISTEGVVTPSATEDTEVTLTATITNGAASETKAYTVTVPQNDLITFDEIKGKNLYEGSIVSNLVLPAKLRNETAIYWESSNENVIAANGSVTRNNDASHSVTLTAKKASDNSVVKEFNLYVIGDEILNDDMQDNSKMKEVHNLAYKKDTTWLIDGMQIADSTTNGSEIYAVYNAAPGAKVTAEVARYGGDRSVSFWTSPDGVEYTQLGSGRSVHGEAFEFAQAGDWKKDIWESTNTIPDGARFIKVYAGNLTSAMITNVKITSNTEADVTFADIANSNASANTIMSNLDLSAFESVESSNTNIIAVDGSVTRPEKDTVVTLTAKINNDSVEATKIFTLTVLGTKEEAKSEKPWILYNGADGLALISKSALAKDYTIEFDADVFYAGNAAKTATGIIAVYDSTGKLLEIKTAEKALSASAEKQRVSTELTLTKDSYTGAIVRGFIWEKGTLKSLGEYNAYTAK